MAHSLVIIVIPMLEEEKVVCWNCQGARSGQFMRELKELVREYKPVITILLEPKISGKVADETCRRIGKSHWVVKKPMVSVWSLDVVE